MEVCFVSLPVALSPLFPDKHIMGFEIRDKLVNFVGEKIRSLRSKQNECHNIAVLRTNSMRHLTNYLRGNTLEKIFICFPDPHFKTTNHRRRIINQGFLSEYAYVLKKGGKLYCITDVEELHKWHISHLDKHSLFKKVPDEEAQADPCFQLMFNKTEEGQKVERNHGRKWGAVYVCTK